MLHSDLSYGKVSLPTCLYKKPSVGCHQCCVNYTVFCFFSLLIHVNVHFQTHKEKKKKLSNYYSTIILLSTACSLLKTQEIDNLYLLSSTKMPPRLGLCKSFLIMIKYLLTENSVTTSIYIEFRTFFFQYKQ